MTSASEGTVTAEAINAVMKAAIPVAHNMGVKATEARPGYASSMVPIEGNGNHFGVMYAGVLFTVAEMLGGAIAMASFDSSAYYPLVKDLQIAFRRPATTDVTAEVGMSDAEIARVAAEAAEHGKADFTLESKVTDANGVVVATTTGIYQLRAIGK